MSKKLVFRIIGALASALIIVSMFIPFISVTGYSVSLWEQNSTLNSLYIPIMIMVFGAIGVITFALGIKTEFAYMSGGALTFFIVMQIVNVLGNGTFSTLGIAFYTLVVGTFLTCFMAFLLNLKDKNKKEESSAAANSGEVSVLNQIDKLYNEPTTQELPTIQPVDNIVVPVEPLPVQNLQPEEPKIENSIPDNLAINEPVMVNPVVTEEPTMVNPVVQDFGVTEPYQELTPVNPVVQDFGVTEPYQEPTPVNPVVQDFGVTEPYQEPTPVNPVVQDFGVTEPQPQPTPVNPVVQDFGVTEPQPEPTPVNPVVNEFNNYGPNTFNNSNLGSGDTDIFGQPINR